jgi:hypothetical protein
MIYKTSFMLLLFFLFWGCDLKQAPVEINFDTIYDTLPSYEEEESYPYDDTFQYVMNKSLYESPDANKTDLYGGFYDLYFSNLFLRESFYLDRDKNLVFTLKKEANTPKQTSRLIQKETWSTADSEGNYFISTLRCYKPKEIDSYTWAQVHGLDYNYPLVSLTWERNMNGQYDHIWAIMTKSSPGVNEPKIYEYIDLGKRPDDFFPAEIHIRENILEIKINYSTMTTQNVSYWENVPSYFRAGMYLDMYLDGGVAGVAFSDLRFENSETNVSFITHF